MDKNRILRIASAERQSRKYDQRQADLRNIVAQAVNGKYNQEFFDATTIQKTSNDEFWTRIIRTVTNTHCDDPANYNPLSLYEYTAYVAARATQLGMGVSGADGVDVTRRNTTQAMTELETGQADFVVRRHTPSGKILHFSGPALVQPPVRALRHFPQEFVAAPRPPIS